MLKSQTGGIWPESLGGYRRNVHKGKLQGTYIRVGSSNRQADEAIIAELERRKRNISFDGELVMDKPAKDLDIANFKEEYKEKTGEILDSQTLRKLELTKDIQGVEYPTNALILFSDDELRQSMFHFAKVECARFKGTNSEEFIDQKSIYSNISTQAEEAYNFVLRHINKGATVEGVYTISRWEYPVKAVREVIRNAIVHRDYSLTGKDVKVAVYDDLIEITSQGLLPPSIDYSAMESRQSDARNKIIAPVFKHFGVIDQWGNGLKLIADELRDYPQIDFRWKEVGLSFQVQFVKLDFVAEQEQQESGAELGAEFGQELPQNAVLTQQESRAELRAEFGAEFGQELPQNAVLTQQESGAELRAEFGQELKKTTLYSSILMQLFINEMNKQELANALSLETVSGYMNRTISKLLEQKLIDRTIPNNPNHPAQKFRLTERGKIFLELLAHKK